MRISTWLGCLLAAASAPAISSPGLTTDIINLEGQVIGTVQLTETEDGLLVDAKASGLPPGSRALHFHEKGVCNPDDGFESAGDHYNPHDREHGFKADDGPHAGDLPNQMVGVDGVLRVHLLAPKLSLEGGDAPLLDHDGSALIVHADADDYRSQPSGDAGDRIACAQIGG